MPHVPTHEAIPLSPAQRAESAEMIERALKIPAVRPEQPTSYKDETPPRPTGAQPVEQPDSRLVPQWATGVAVSGIGIGVGAIGIGLGAKLFFDSVTTQGAIVVGLIVSAPLLLISAAGAAWSKVKKATPPNVTNNFNGSVHIKKRTMVKNTNQPFSFQRTTADGADEQ